MRKMLVAGFFRLPPMIQQILVILFYGLVVMLRTLVVPVGLIGRALH